MKLEALQAGAAAIVVNGLHRDTNEAIELGLPVTITREFRAMSQ